MYHEGDHRPEVSKCEVDGIVEVVEGSHEHEHRPEAEDGDQRGIVSLLEFEDAAQDISNAEVAHREAEGNSPKSIRCLNRILQYFLSQVVIEVVKRKTKQPHDTLSFRVRYILQQLLLPGCIRGVDTIAYVM